MLKIKTIAIHTTWTQKISKLQEIVGCKPRAKSARFAATATADPLDDPPGTRSGAHGLVGVP